MYAENFERICAKWKGNGNVSELFKKFTHIVYIKINQYGKVIVK